MDQNAALSELEALAEKLGVAITYDHFTGDAGGSGGICKVKGSWRIIIERRMSPSEKVSVLARALGRFDVDDHFLSPAVRELVNRYRPPDVIKNDP